MNRKNAAYLCIAMISLTACKSDLEQFNDNYSLEITNPKSSWNASDEIKLNVNDAGERGIDSVAWYVNSVRVKNAGGITLSRKLTNDPLGKLVINAIVYKNGLEAKTTEVITRFAPTRPEILSFDIINIFPHNEKSYTQGLEFYNGQLYESSGQLKESAVRVVDLTTGTTTAITEMKSGEFGEGLTVLNDKIYQLTWQNEYGVIYDMNLKRINTFDYNRSTEGWGLANDGTTIYKTDGTDRIWKINGKTLKEEGFISVTTNTELVPKLNEIEWINGKIYANVYLKNAIVVIDPKTGAVESFLDLSSLVAKEPNYSANDQVLNGIAYNKEENRLFVTGKNWTQLFEIKIK